MADTSDIEAAIVTLLVGAVYPNGTAQPSAIAGSGTISVERGWPTEADLRAADAANAQMIRVHAITGMATDAERYFRDWQPVQGASSLTVAISGQAVTFGGTAATGIIAVVITAAAAFTYVCQASDTPSTVAAALAAKISGASASGAVLTVTGYLARAAAYAPGTALMEVGRIKQAFNISIWATSPALRDALFSAINPQLAFAYRLEMPDGSVATRIGKSLQLSGPDDLPSRAQSWRRDIRIMFEFGLNITESVAPAATVETTYTPNDAAEPAVTLYS